MPNGHGGRREGAGRKLGSPTKRRREIIDEAAKDGITPLEVQLRTMRALWDEANKGGTLDFEKATAACAIAKDAAPYLHPRLSNVEAQIAVTGHEAALAELEEIERSMPAVAAMNGAGHDLAH
jgi:malonyl CoA-acyl carrier protein transacylase